MTATVDRHSDEFEGKPNLQSSAKRAKKKAVILRKLEELEDRFSDLERRASRTLSR
jgi:hypothetical protein